MGQTKLEMAAFQVLADFPFHSGTNMNFDQNAGRLRRLSRNPPEPIKGPRLKRHFEVMRRILLTQFDVCADLSPVTVGGAREWFIQEFLRNHVPGVLNVGSGHLLYEDDPSRQQDVIVYHRDSLALPIGGVGLFLPDQVLACMEVKSTLDKLALIEDCRKKFESLRAPQPLKVLVAGRLKNNLQYRGYLGKWAKEANLPPAALPDLVVFCDNPPVVRGGSLKVLDSLIEDPNPELLYKLGAYDDDRWLGLALLVFELAQRVGSVDWRPYLEPLLPSRKTIKVLPDRKL